MIGESLEHLVLTKVRPRDWESPGSSLSKMSKTFFETWRFSAAFSAASYNCDKNLLATILKKWFWWSRFSVFVKKFSNSAMLSRFGRISLSIWCRVKTKLSASVFLTFCRHFSHLQISPSGSKHKLPTKKIIQKLFQHNHFNHLCHGKFRCEG